MNIFIWIMIIILLTITEIITINLTTIWYVASGIVALILSFFVHNFVIEFGVFSILGTILLITTKSYLLKILKKNNEATNLDRVIGMNAVVTEKIKKNQIGEVKVDGKKWSAYSDDDINIGTIVKVLKIDGVKLKVEKVGD